VPPHLLRLAPTPSSHYAYGTSHCTYTRIHPHAQFQPTDPSTLPASWVAALLGPHSRARLDYYYGPVPPPRRASVAASASASASPRLRAAGFHFILLRQLSLSSHFSPALQWFDHHQARRRRALTITCPAQGHLRPFPAQLPRATWFHFSLELWFAPGRAQY
jgi:hypothetical protein